MAKQGREDTAIQVGGNNVTSGTVAVQVGRVIQPGSEGYEPSQPSSPSPSREQGETRAVNARSGNARVGLQADVIEGDVTIIMPGGRR